MKLRNIAVIATMALLTGCAFGIKVDYRMALPYVQLEPSTEKRVIEVATVDQRPYILSGNKRPQFVGVSRALYYNPYNINTASGLGLVTDLQSAMITALARDPSVQARATQNRDRASASGTRLLVLTVREWKSDAYMRVRFDYDVTAEVKDEQGLVLATKTAKGRGAITHFLNAGADVLNQALGDHEIVKALGSTPTPLVAPARAPAALTPATASAKPGIQYDDCIRRVLRISDQQLRLSAMSACDSAK
ncbi:MULTISPECIES: hypothetical protein [unclassified Pseudomonas]|uniref:hypothetical protein n=1 Tax=unclassified Pseudomonas TaxID=196821 RepID=UPI00244BCF26|nr:MULTISPECIES: hypothetical protein [unclassified Pseudomonas]MDG9929996.1 hypothetical protein [Pseudomonas sp. GD04042]MDH0483226.1 hypothetical protein [Pseudomonas sp. GD04015]MDH0606313.1 hypothetical protein [Pseudomonas sp. GD03869]